MPDTHIDFHDQPRAVAGRARGGRDSQQDAVACLHDATENAYLLVLADGMGGDGAGEVAADGVMVTTRRLWQQHLWQQQPGAVFLETLCQEAHRELRRRRLRLVSGEPHSTIVALLLYKGRASWAHVGDSRLYHFQGVRYVDRTRDHSLVEWMMQRGELQPEQMDQAGHQHKLLRGLGGDQPPEVEHGGAPLRVGQNFVLCSDGIWQNLSVEELGRYADQSDQQAALHEAVTLAVERGGGDGDNASLIMMHSMPAGHLRRGAANLWTGVRDTLAKPRRRMPD